MAHSVTIALITSLCCCLTPCFGYSISPCDNNKMQIEESDDAALNCTGITHDDMVWRLTHTGGTVSQIGTCYWPSGLCNITDSDYSVSRPERASSVLTVTDNPRTKIAGTVQCAGLNPEGNLEDTVSCDVRVVYTSYQVTNCAVEVTTSTSAWIISGSCDVNKIYASDDHYDCQWFETPQSGSGSRSFTGTVDLVSAFSEGGQTYYKAKCTFSPLPMPTTNGVCSYSLMIDPSNGVHAAGTVQIQSPVGPPVLFNCPGSVIEGDDDTCTCQASAAEPSALVTWSGSGATAVSDTVTLELNDVPKSLDGHSYTCSQYWGGHSTGHLKTTSYTLHVNDPPSSPPQISGNTTRMVGDSLVLNCTVTGGNPPVGYVTFYCGNYEDTVDSISTENGQTVVTSTFEINSLTARDNGSQCMCSANWNPRPALYQSTATVTILVLGEPRYARPATGRQDDDHNYTELDHYQQIGPPEQRTERTEKGTMDRHQYENSDVIPPESSSKAQYENTGFSQEPASSDGHYEITPKGRRPTAFEQDYEIP